jgi:hypothetical protein
MLGKVGRKKSANEKRPIAQVQVSHRNDEEQEVDEATLAKIRKDEATALAAEEAQSAARIERELALRVTELTPKWRAEEDKRWRDTQLEMKEGERRFDLDLKDRKDRLDVVISQREQDLLTIQEESRAEAARRKRLADQERARRLAEEHELAEAQRREEEEEARVYREQEEKKSRKIAHKVGDLVISGCSVAGVGSDHISKMGTYLLQEQIMHDLRPVYKCREHYLFYLLSTQVWTIGYRIGYSGSDNLEAPTDAMCPDQIKGSWRAAAVDDDPDDDDDDRVEYPFIEVEPLREVNRRVAQKAKKAGDVVLLGLSNDVEQCKWMGVYSVTGAVHSCRPTYYNMEATTFLYFDEAIPGWRVSKEVGLEESPLSVTTVANTPELNKASWTLYGGNDEGLDPRLKVLGIRMLEQQIETLVRAADMVTVKGLKKGGKKGHPQGRCVVRRHVVRRHCSAQACRL